MLDHVHSVCICLYGLFGQLPVWPTALAKLQMHRIRLGFSD